MENHFQHDNKYHIVNSHKSQSKLFSFSPRPFQNKKNSYYNLNEISNQWSTNNIQNFIYNIMALPFEMILFALIR